MQTFYEARNKLFERIGNSSKMVLATSANDVVSARTISVLAINGRLYFQTDRSMDKAKEISINPNVAVCLKELQIKGTCRDIGNPNDESNKFFIEKFRSYFPNACEKYTHLSNETVFEITPISAKVWLRVDDCQCIEHIDFVNKECQIECFSL